VFVKVASLITVLVMLFAGAGVTAYAAQDSLPNDMLYPVKTITESLRLNLTTDPVKKVDLLLGQASTRLVEINALVDQGQPVPETVLEQLHGKYSLVIQIIAELPEDDLDLVKDGVYRHLHDRDQIQGRNKSPSKDHPEEQMRCMYGSPADVENCLKLPPGLEEIAVSGEFPEPVNSFADHPLPADDRNGPGPDAGSGSGATGRPGGSKGAGQGH
jgi:hypothetical protein